jgi:hypothetical protein
MARRCTTPPSSSPDRQTGPPVAQDGFTGTNLYDAATDTWTTTTLAIDRHHPSVTLVDGLVLVPDEAAPIAGRLPS